MRNRHQITPEHHKVRLSLGQWNGLPKGKRHIRTGQHRTIIQPIPDHTYRAALSLQLREYAELVLGSAAAARSADRRL